MIKTTHAALMALLMAGAALPAFAQTMQPTTQDQAPPAQTAQPALDQTQGADPMKPAHVKKRHHLHHRHRTKAVTQAKANAGDTTQATTTPANAADTTTDSTAPK